MSFRLTDAFPAYSSLNSVQAPEKNMDFPEKLKKQTNNKSFKWNFCKLLLEKYSDLIENPFSFQAKHLPNSTVMFVLIGSFFFE